MLQFLTDTGLPEAYRNARNVPNRLHDELVRRAKTRNLTLTAYVEEILERTARREPLVLDRSAAEIISAEREERERQLHSLLTRRRSASTS